MRGRAFLALFALGLVGVVAIVPSLAPMIARKPLPPDAPQLPLAAIVAFSLVQPTLLMTAGIAIGLRLVPRLGLRSYIVDAVTTGAPIWPALRRDIPLAVAVGLGQMAVTLPLELAFRPYMGEAWRRLEQDGNVMGGPLAQLVSGVFYGGITEELMLRWGMMTLFAWIAWRVAGKPDAGASKSRLIWIGILGSGVLFGVGHLPIVSSVVSLTPVIVARTVLLNAIAGIAFGWLFWRRSLEAAMVAHATGHVVLFIVRLVT